MKYKKLVVSATLIVSLALLTSGCTSNARSASSSNQTTQLTSESNSENKAVTQKDNNISQNLIYHTNSEGINYEVYTSRSIDTVLIAAALYNNFNSNYLMPNSDQVELFKKTKEYFSPYSNHEFIRNFGKYMAQNKSGDIDSSVLDVLLCYKDLPDLSSKFNVTENMPDCLNSKEKQDEFISQLKSFYNDTHAENFFNNNINYYDALTSYIENNEDSGATVKLINAAIDYTGNKEKYYNGKEISYCTLLSFYRSLGSFYTVTSDNTVNFVSVQPAYAHSNNKQDDFNINAITKTSIHEYLHNFINTPVYENLDLIKKVTINKDKKNYCSKTYYEFPWNRITDENFVRAIEARLYKNILNENLAFSEIIDPETKAGFIHVQTLYNKLESYEKNRQKYPTINEFIPELINEFYN